MLPPENAQCQLPPRFVPAWRHPEHALYTASFDQRVDRVEDMIHDAQHDIHKVYSVVCKLGDDVTEVQHGVDHVYFDHMRSFSAVLERISDAFTGLRATFQYHLDRIDGDLWLIQDALTRIAKKDAQDTQGASDAQQGVPDAQQPESSAAGALNADANAFVVNDGA